ncbi:hypothetical protein MIR68_009275 [Amoeboaphelidium protococcarum]|nr:hypothetical protein MIR68_009275 [Amoeboaphelidium protococcarum]KAI3644614.1 hypothetical protein MP228_010778 [Amoeboaphelidium protococcarum]
MIEILAVVCIAVVGIMFRSPAKSKALKEARVHPAPATDSSDSSKQQQQQSSQKKSDAAADIAASGIPANLQQSSTGSPAAAVAAAPPQVQRDYKKMPDYQFPPSFEEHVKNHPPQATSPQQ